MAPTDRIHESRKDASPHANSRLRSEQTGFAEDQHVTVREAMKLTGKSESTIKRLLREIVHDPEHADRVMILPAPEEVERRRQAVSPISGR